METVLITGGNGFTAQHLEILLNKQNFKVLFLDRIHNDITPHYVLRSNIAELCKIESIEELRKFQIGGIFHLATTYRHSYDDKDFNRLVEANINLTYQLAQFCSISGLPLIVPGSFFQEHFQNRKGNSSIYATIKNCGESILSFMSNTSQIKTCVTRQFESYGHFDQRNKILNRIIDSLILENEIVLPATDLNLDYLSIEDICTAYLCIFRYLKEFEGEGVQKFEISSGNSYKLSQIISMVEEISQKRLRIALNRKNRDLSAVSEIEYSQNYPPKWKPQSSLEQDLSRLIDNRKLMLSKGDS